MSGVTMLIGADVAPTPASEAAFLAGDAALLLQGGLKEIWERADARVFNLETPLADADTPIEKCGPALRASAACARGIAALAPDGVALANNHILDHGAAGLNATFAALEQAGVASFGAGADKARADEPLLLVKDGLRICVYAACEHEFSCAGTDTPGANAFDALEIADRVRALKQTCDRLVVLYHGGREYYPYPSPELMRRCRKMADCGADAVICQHSHCVGSYERYGGGAIVYGQGNFLFDMDDAPCFEQGLLVRLTFAEHETEATFVPIIRSNHGAAPAAGAAETAILDGFFARSKELMQPGFVQAHYCAYAQGQREKLLKVFLSGNPLLRAVNVLYGRRPTRVYSRATQLAIKNSLTCEAINELMTEGL